MKKAILVITAVLSISSMAFAQGSLVIQSQSTAGGVSTTTTNISSATGWYTGSLTLEIFSLAGGASAGQISAINSAWANPSTAFSLLTSDGFVQQTINGLLSTNIASSGGSFNIGTQTIGNSGTLTTGSTVTYAIYATASSGTLAGVLAFSTSTTGTPSPGTPINFSSIWPNQNLFLTAVPEPTTMALAGLGGLSLLIFRRRK